MLRTRRTELTMTAKADGVFDDLCSFGRQDRRARAAPHRASVSPAPSVLATLGALFICCPLPIAANITKLRRSFMVRDVTGWRSSKPTSTRGRQRARGSSCSPTMRQGGSPH